MFTDLKPYPEYKRFDSDGLETVPADWAVNRLGQIGTFLKGKGGSREDDAVSGVPCIRYGDLYKHHNTFIVRAHSFVSEDESANYTRLLYGDLLFALSGESLSEIGKSAVNLVADRAICGGDMAIFRANIDINLRFLGYSADVIPSVVQKSRMGRGDIIVHVSVGNLKRLSVVLPPVVEQAAIVKYLGHANARIDRAIAAKRKLIALLEEQKHAIINQAVTRGLDPSVPLKDSGIPWLDQVPAHWPVAALRHRYSQSLGKMLDSGRIAGHDLLPYLRNTDVQWGRVNTLDLPEMDISDAEFDRYTLDAGDLLVCEGGDVGRAAIWESVERVGYQKALHRLRPADANEDVPRYLLYVFRVASGAGAFSDGHVSTIAHLTGEKLRAHRFAWPSASEQQSIVDHLDSSTVATDRTIDRVSREIELLREFRTRLTADVVTGQVDIRAPALRLPELDLSDLVSDVGEQDEDDLDAELAEVDA